MVDAQTFSIAVASASVVLAAAYYVLQVRHQGKTRDTELAMRLYATFSKKD